MISTVIIRAAEESGYTIQEIVSDLGATNQALHRELRMIFENRKIISSHIQFHI